MEEVFVTATPLDAKAPPVPAYRVPRPVSGVIVMESQQDSELKSTALAVKLPRAWKVHLS
jgi:hypothetical protein